MFVLDERKVEQRTFWLECRAVITKPGPNGYLAIFEGADAGIAMRKKRAYITLNDVNV